MNLDKQLSLAARGIRFDSWAKREPADRAPDGTCACAGCTAKPAPAPRSDAATSRARMVHDANYQWRADGVPEIGRTAADARRSMLERARDAWRSK